MANPIVTIDGHEYMFPLAGAAKDNYLEPNNVNGDSQLSPLPCKNYSAGACHHDYVALDMGLYKEKVDELIVLYYSLVKDVCAKIEDIYKERKLECSLTESKLVKNSISFLSENLDD